MKPVYDLASVFAAQIHQGEKEADKVYEPLIAVVTDNKDPSKLGRVKVKYPVISQQDTSWWAPIIMLGAGKNRGWFFIPEVDDEVLVLFEHGDMTRPLIVGALWNGKDKPPDKNPGKNPRRLIKSRQGSKITFVDDDDGSIHQLIIEDGASKGRITIDSDKNKIIIEALEGDVCFQSPKGDFKIVAKEIQMKAKEKMEFHAGTSMQWGTGTSATIKGQTTTIVGSNVNMNCGKSQMPEAPTADPKDVPDPYGS
jgi:uncharacterized protein involved in type VI secretion and phage assembly